MNIYARLITQSMVPVEKSKLYCINCCISLWSRLSLPSLNTLTSMQEGGVNLLTQPTELGPPCDVQYIIYRDWREDTV